MALYRKWQQLRLDFKRVAYILRHSITKRLLVVVFSIYLSITIAITLFHMDFEYEMSKLQTIRALKNIQSMIYNSLGQAIWEFNNTQIDSILSGLYTNQYIVGIKLEMPENYLMPEITNREIGLIEDDHGNIVNVDPSTKQSNIVNSTFLRLLPDAFLIEHTDALGRKIPIGKMYIYSSNKVVFEQVKYSYILLILSAVFKTLCLWIFILWAGYYFISKPLLQLTDAIKALATGQWNTELSLATKRDKNKTEINTLFETFNTMTKNLQSTQHELMHSRNRLNEIFDAMPSALMSVNNKNIIQGWNKYMAQLTNIDVKSAIDQDLSVVFPAFDPFKYLIHNTLREGLQQEVQHVHLPINTSNAAALYHITAYPIRSIIPPEVVIRIDDVTEQIKNETGLAQVEKLASVGASIAGVAHEINNPLASIMQSTQNILRRIDPALDSNKKIAETTHLDLQQQYKYLEQREIISFLNSIHDAGERASNIVKNMLKFTRRSTTDIGMHNFEHIINESLQLCENDISILEHVDFKNIKVEKNLAAAKIMVECSPQELQQVILNIIRNAVQAMPLEQSDKRISISVEHPAENKICLKIADNGPGMPTEILDKIFQPFFTTKPSGAGTGLGLSVCRNIIVQKHHGDLSVESTVGKGALFLITLPIKQPK